MLSVEKVDVHREETVLELRQHQPFWALGPMSISTTINGARCWKFRVLFMIVLFTLGASVRIVKLAN